MVCVLNFISVCCLWFQFYMGLKVEDKRLKALGVYSGVILLMSFQHFLE